jgi:ubiquinone/menaquinone biosynthesis C-methylase UbiE
LFEDYEYLSLDIKSGTNVDIVADAHKLPFKDESFVMVVSSETLQYVTNPFKVVAEAYRILRLGGIVCLVSSLRARVGLIGNHWSDPEQDTFRYYAKGMRALLTDAGFTDIIRCEVAKNGSCWGVARK